MGRPSAKSIQARLGVYTVTGVQHRWAKALARARSHGVDIPEKFIPRRLRASFITAMRKRGADFAVLERYIGHAPSTLLSERYDKLDMERMRPIAALAQETAKEADK